MLRLRPLSDQRTVGMQRTAMGENRGLMPIGLGLGRKTG